MKCRSTSPLVLCDHPPNPTISAYLPPPSSRNFLLKYWLSPAGVISNRTSPYQGSWICQGTHREEWKTLCYLKHRDCFFLKNLFDFFSFHRETKTFFTFFFHKGGSGSVGWNIQPSQELDVEFADFMVASMHFLGQISITITNPLSN